MLPNVVYVGMGKSGSTLLHKLFLKHPDIYVNPAAKEINFFSKDVNWKQGVRWYRDLFSGHREEKWVVDISPGYHNKTKSLVRMRDVLGKNVKVIFTFRRFTEFAFSRYLHRIRGKIIPGGFVEMLEQKSMFYKPLDVMIGEYIDAFGEDNVLIMHYEKEFNRDAPFFEDSIYRFLKLSVDEKYYDKGKDVRVNSGYYPRFVYAKNEPYEENMDGVDYRVPANTLVFCSGRKYKNIYWTKRAASKADEVLKIQDGWTTFLDEETYQYVHENYTIPLAERLERRLGISFRHWYVSCPRRIEYRPAPLPDAYIKDAALLDDLLGINETQRPWS